MILETNRRSVQPLNFWFVVYRLRSTGSSNHKVVLLIEAHAKSLFINLIPIRTEPILCFA